MSRLDSALGFLSIVGTVAILAVVGLRENARLTRDARAWDVRKIEMGAQLYDQYCANCHGQNGSGGVCPPLDARSGLHGGDLGPGVAWRLEELGWDRNQSYEYIYNSIAGGRALSTRPDRYPGNRVPAAPPLPGTPTPAATSRPPMAMPAWGQSFGGPLRLDQMDAIASYIAAFRDAVPADADAARAAAADNRESVGSSAQSAASAPTLTESVPITSNAGVTGTAAVTVTGAVTTTAVPAAAPGTPVARGVVARGADLFRAQACAGCHALPGVSTSVVGPSLAGVYARAAGRVNQADYAGQAASAEAYVRESIRNARAYTVPGYNPNLMPAFGADRLSEQDISDLVAYLVERGG